MTDASRDERGGELLRLAVVDEDDLAVLSAHLQDAVLSLDDVAYLPRTRRFAVVVSRIDWLSLSQGVQLRRRTGFHFERVMRVQRTGFDARGDAQPLQLLSIVFSPTAAPAGEVRLTFAGHAVIKLDVECLEAELRDLGEPWPVSDCPSHRLDAEQAGR